MNQDQATHGDAKESRTVSLRPPLATSDDDQQLLLRLEGVHHSLRSFETRVFINLPNADAQTPSTDRHYAGSFHMYGHGLPSENREGIAAVLDGYVPEVGKELEAYDAAVNVTATLWGLIQRGEVRVEQPIRVTFVVIAPDGSALAHETFKVDGVRFEVVETNR